MMQGSSRGMALISGLPVIHQEVRGVMTEMTAPLIRPQESTETIRMMLTMVPVM